MTDLSPGPGSGEDFRTVLDRMADGFFAVDTDWRVTYANERAAEILRSAMTDEALDDAESIEGTHLWEAIPDAVGTEFYDEYHEAMETQEPVSFDSHYRPLGTWFDVRTFPSESGLSVYLRDITERRELEQRRQESLHATQRLYAVSSDQDRSFEEKVESMLELGCEYLGMPNGFLTRIEGDTQYVEFSNAEHPELRAGESCPLEEAYCKRTVELDSLLTIVNAADEGWDEDPAYDRFGLKSYIGGRIEIGGERYGTLCFADTAPRDEAFTDTQRTFVELLTRWMSYELERRRAAERLERERDRLDEFASVVSHDLRNPLSTARGRVDLLADEVDSDHVDPVQRALSRMETLIENVLMLARDGGGVDETSRVELVAHAEDAWKTTASRGGTLHTAADAFELRADEQRLRQLLENLFRNAVDHGTADGRGESAGVAVTVGPLADGGGFYVADDGPGIPEDERDRVFESGYTTTSDGTGFGLDIVSEIAGGHGWEVAVTDSDDGGARFEFTGVDRP
ncbi:ATP-binding protein [Halorubrum sp. SD626R]|uniref:sensor histidine kinase n=1 Tax=Halorubrum sp. SD626R TaxID=1419722 RepID=UPI000AB392EC|nr:ATP-binding protein [Halorubrum sp. SD626R]TKX80713.1 PAS domain-containing protein [Halorubrum sp. SD626R]